MNKRLVTIVWLTMITGSAFAGEFVVEGQVLQVDPIVEQHTQQVATGNCNPVKPRRHTSLSELLEWDLRPECRMRNRVDEVVTGYKVHYEWDNRRWETVTREPPGDTIALRVTVR